VRNKTLLGLGLVLGFFGAFCGFGHYHLIFNSSPSIPLGFYLRTADNGAPYAWVCLNGEAEEEAKRHGLVFHGACPDGSFPLLKPVCPANEWIAFDAAGFRARGRVIPHTQPKATGLDGIPLHHYPFGTYAPEGNRVWLISSMQDSFDSRYFGPVERTQILSYARPFLVTTLIH
jgi:conjugative transfer signal peptidase TraF